jgi:DNA-binding XRE family transcriptional regulator
MRRTRGVSDTAGGGTGMHSEGFAVAATSIHAVAQSLATIARQLSLTDFEACLELIRHLRQEDRDDPDETTLRALSALLDSQSGGVELFSRADERKSPGMKRWTEHVGVRIRELRTKAGMTQSQRARAAGLTQAHVSRMENADLSDTHLTLAKIARALEVDDGPFPLAE